MPLHRCILCSSISFLCSSNAPSAFPLESWKRLFLSPALLLFLYSNICHILAPISLSISAFLSRNLSDKHPVASVSHYHIFLSLPSHLIFPLNISLCVIFFLIAPNHSGYLLVWLFGYLPVPSPKTH